jgi:hypothetical protein
MEEIEVFEITNDLDYFDTAAATEPVNMEKDQQMSVAFSDPLLDSRIISVFPDIFAEFRGKKFSLLWRGSRDGFGAQRFHERCDGHGNTVTLIEDTDGNTFGGFTPLEWESRVHNGWEGQRDNRFKGDDSERTFIFTLKNPHNIPARKFRLKPEQKHRAIFPWIERGPHFWDIAIYDNCNRNTSNNIELDDSYINDTGVNKYDVMTGSRYFRVKEIEVFELTDDPDKVIPLGEPDDGRQSDDPSSPWFGARIISVFPEVFAEFQGKKLVLLWRGSRDGFGSRRFHGRCDGRRNTLIVIQDTDGNLFGGYTPVKWDASAREDSEEDVGQKSFLFTLKNPHDIPARRFALKT